MNAQTLEQVAVELEARVGRYKPDMVDAANVTERQLTRIENSATKMEREVGRSFGRAAQHSRLLGYQISDIGVQLSAGTSPFLVLAQQGPQVANALEGARGAVGRFATFLSGPYGAAILAATTLLGVWLSKNKEAGESIDELVAKLQAQAQKAAEAERANSIFATTVEGLTDAVRRNREETERLNEANKTGARIALENAFKNQILLEQKQKDVEQTLAQAEAQLELNRARNQVAGNDPRVTGPLNAENDAIAARIKKMREDLASLRDSLGETAQRIQENLSRRVVELGDRDDVQKIRDHYDKLIDDTRKRAVTEGTVSTELAKQVRLLKDQRDQRVKQAQDAQRESRKSTSSLPAVTGQEIANALGTRITSGTRSPAENAAARGAKNSYHLSGQAIDIPLTVNGKPLTKAGIRAALEPLGVEIKELLGPGDKGHSDHFHIAFSKKRRGGDEVARSAQQSADTEERRRQTFENELAQLLGDEIAAKRALVESAEEIAKLRLAEIETERQSYNDNLDSLVAQRKLLTEEADQLRGINDERAKLRTELVARNEQVRAFRMEEAERERNARVDSVRRADDAEVLRGQADLARTVDERNAIERRLVDLQYQEEKAQNDRVIATYESLKAKKGILESELAEAKSLADAARIRNASIGARKGSDLEGIDRNNPFDRYIDDVSDVRTRAQEATVRQFREVSDGISEGLAEELGIKSDYVKSLFSIFLEDAVFRPLAEALRNRGSSGGGGFFSSLLNIGASIFGGGSLPGTAGGMDLRGFRAGGGRASAGSLYRINENATPGNPEFFQPDGDGRIYSLGQMNAMASRGAPASQGPIELRIYADDGTFISRVAAISQGEAVKVTMEAAPAIIDASARETKRQLSRPRMPGAGR